MIIDDYLYFSKAQALTASADSTSHVDFSSDRNIGVGEPLVVVITLDVAADFTTTDETYVVNLEVDDNTSFSSGVVVGSATITGGDAAGTQYVIPVPPDSRMERFAQLQYVLGGTTPTVTLSASLRPADGIDNYISYANGYTITG